MKFDIDRFFSGNSRTSIIQKNILGSLLIKGLSILTSLLLVPMTINYVNPAIYGVWLTLSSFILWFNFFDIGFTLGLKNKLAEALAVKDYDKGKRLVSTTYYMMVVIFLPLCLLLVGTIPLIDWTTILNIPSVYREDVITTLYILSFFLFVQMFLNVLTAVVSAFQKVALSSLFLMLGQVLTLLLLFVLTQTVPPSLIGLSICISIAPVIILSAASVFLYSNRFKKVSPSLKCIDTRMIKELFGMGIKFFIIQIQVIVLYQTTNMIISNIEGPESVTQYNIAYKYLGIVTMLFNIILTPLWPAFTDAYALRDFQWMRNIYRKMTHIYIGIVIVMLGMVAVSPIAYRLWIGESVTIPFSLTLMIALFFIIHSWDSLQVYMINGVGAVKLQTMVVLIGLFCHIPMAFFFSRFIGIQGVILSMILINIIYASVFTIQIRKIIGGKTKKIWVE